MSENCTYFDKDTFVRGELSTGDLIVEGSFDGNIESNGSVLLKNSVQINADIRTRKLFVQAGAAVDGTIILEEDRN